MLIKIAGRVRGLFAGNMKITGLQVVK